MKKLAALILILAAIGHVISAMNPAAVETNVIELSGTTIKELTTIN